MLHFKNGTGEPLGDRQSPVANSPHCSLTCYSCLWVLVRSTGLWRRPPWVRIQALPFSSHVTLDKLLKLSVARCSHLQNRKIHVLSTHYVPGTVPNMSRRVIRLAPCNSPFRQGPFRPPHSVLWRFNEIMHEATLWHTVCTREMGATHYCTFHYYTRRPLMQGY